VGRPVKIHVPEEDNNVLTDISIRIYSFVTNLPNMVRREEGQDLVEYAVLVGFIGVAAAVAFIAFMPDALNDMLTIIGDCLAFDSSGCTIP
jgi:Flp pilus assembly pilin Flp